MVVLAGVLLCEHGKTLSAGKNGGAQHAVRLDKIPPRLLRAEKQPGRTGGRAGKQPLQPVEEGKGQIEVEEAVKTAAQKPSVVQLGGVEDEEIASDGVEHVVPDDSGKVVSQ